MLNSLYFQSERLWIQWDEKTFCTLHVTCSRDGGSDSIWDFHLKFFLNQHFLIMFLHSLKGVKRLSFEFRHSYRGSAQLITQIANFKEMQSRVDTCNYESVWWFRLWDCFSYSLLIPIKKGPLNRSYRYSHSDLEWLLCRQNDKRDNKHSLCQQHLSVCLGETKRLKPMKRQQLKSVKHQHSPFIFH